MKQVSNSIPTIAIVGRPNVGKSSLFNAIFGRRLAIVHEMSGVTRDRIVAPISWRGRHFQLVDTGGLGTFTGEKKNIDIWDTGIRDQVEAAINGADVLFFVCDVTDGVVSLDVEVARRLRESGKPIFFIAAKADNTKLENQALVDFATLGFKDIYPVSALHRRGITSLLEATVKGFVPVSAANNTEEPFKIAVVGRPNVGKSSLVNRLLGEERVMVSDIAGTTRDSVDTPFEMEYKGETLPVSLIDTAGLRKRAKVNDLVEHFSIMRSESAIKRARLVLFVVESKSDGLTAQDRRVARIIAEQGKACVIVANKWDECQGEFKQKNILEEIYYTLPRMTYAPVVFTSATRGYNFNLLLDVIAEVMAQMEVQLPTSVVNRLLTDAFTFNAPPVIGRAPLKFYYATMLGNEPPRFVLFVNKPELCAKNYLGYLNNYIRKSFDFSGLPIELQLRARSKREFHDFTSAPMAKKKARAISQKRKSKDRKSRTKR